MFSENGVTLLYFCEGSSCQTPFDVKKTLHLKDFTRVLCFFDLLKFSVSLRSIVKCLLKFGFT